MANRFPAGMEEFPLAALPTLLDPQFKKVAFSNRSSADKMARVLLNEATALHLPTTTSPATAESTASDSSSSSGLWQFFEQQVADISSQQTSSTFAFVEMDQYLKAPLLPRKEDPLQWWHDYSHIYPTIIAKVA